MLWFHPLLQFSATVLSFYVLFLGITRFRQSHLKHGVRFNWKRHVFWGQAVLIVWLLGLIGGLVMVFRLRSAILITGPHALFGLVLGLLAVFGLISGLYMNRVKKKEKFFAYCARPGQHLGRRVGNNTSLDGLAGDKFPDFR